VRNSAGEVSSDLSAAEPFAVEIDYVNLAPGASLGATVLLFNSDGVHVFSALSNREPSWHGRAFPGGPFRSTCRVPGNLLPEGRFDVSVIVWADNYSVSHREDCVVEFEVHDTAEARGDYFGEWSGVVRPLLEWETRPLAEPGAGARGTASAALPAGAAVARDETSRGE
jgi:hypothetical protein